MDCPVCKYPNPQGATHCGMCMEVFNRSAAQTYLQAMKRERRQTEEEPPAPVVPETREVVERVEHIIHRIDWKALAHQSLSLLKRLKWAGVAIVGMVALWIAASYLLDPNLWYHLFGKKLAYAFSGKAPPQYLIGLTDDIKFWSERQGRLDTPMDQFHEEEIGNVLCEKKGTAKKGTQAILVRAREWIQLVRDERGSTSRSIPLNHPTLARVRLLLDKKGRLLDRGYKLSPRLAKGLPFLAPKWPPGTLREGKQWNEKVEWIDLYRDWKIYWAGTLHWTIGAIEPCGSGTCVKLSYRADLRPTLWAAPGWTARAVHLKSVNVSSEGAALFDTRHKFLVSNTFTYEGLLHFAINNLGLIPWELRIGRRVKGPGEILLRYQNKIDIRRN